MKKIKNLIVGCGLAGSILAQHIASELNEEVLVIDKRNHIAGNCFDYDKNNILIHKYGPHAFHTNNSEVWQYLSNYTDWYQYSHHVKASIDNHLVPLPFNLNSIDSVFEVQKAQELKDKLIKLYGEDNIVSILDLKKNNDPLINELAEFIYQKVFLGYTLKQWGIKPEDLDKSVTARVPVLTARDDRYFQDEYQAMPKLGYTKMFENMLKNPLIKVELNTDFFDIKDSISYDRLIYTGPIDAYFHYKYGELDYRSIDIDLKEINSNFFQPVTQVNYPCEHDYTRITEFKHFYNTKSDKTIIGYEYPQKYVQGKNEPYYPVHNEKNTTIYKKYEQEAKKENNVLFVGRLAQYKYMNMDIVVKSALDKFKELKGS